MGLTWHRVRGIAWLSIRVKIGEQKCTDFSSVHMSKEDIHCVRQTGAGGWSWSASGWRLELEGYERKIL